MPAPVIDGRAIGKQQLTPGSELGGKAAAGAGTQRGIAQLELITETRSCILGHACINTARIFVQQVPRCPAEHNTTAPDCNIAAGIQALLVLLRYRKALAEALPLRVRATVVVLRFGPGLEPHHMHRAICSHRKASPSNGIKMAEGLGGDAHWRSPVSRFRTVLPIIQITFLVAGIIDALAKVK